MDNSEKKRFQQLLNNTFNNNLKDVNDALDKHITIMNNKKQANKIAYVKHKEDSEFKKKKTEYDKQYYQDHKDKLLNERKQKYHNDNEYQTKIKEQQNHRYLELNKLKNLNFNSSSSVSGSANL